MKAAGKTITVGELIEHFSAFDQNDRVVIQMYGDEHTVVELDDTLILGPDDDHPYQSDHELLENLHQFTGTKKKMLELIAGHVG